MRNNHTITFPELHGDTKRVRFEFVNLRGKEGIQLGEIIFHHLGEGINPVVAMAAPVQTEVFVQPRQEVIIQPQPMAQPIVGGGALQRYFLFETARVTAEHHKIFEGEDGKPQNLLRPGEEIWNKWSAPDHNASWVEIEFAERLMFRGISFRSAGNHPKKAPTEVKVWQIHMLEGGWRDIGLR